MSDRYNELKNILEARRYFKVVCGAGNEDPDEVYRLSLVYTLAGAVGIDVSANVDVVRASMKGIDRAFELAPSFGFMIETRPFINVSVGLKGDPHVRKVRIIEEKCTECGLCFENCDQEAIAENPYRVIAHRCIGCGKCDEICESDAVEFYTNKVDFLDILPRCIESGAENLELHAIIADDESVMRDWKIVAKVLPDQFISMCLDRSQLSDAHLIDRIRQAKDVAGDRLIIQADGAPMSGGSDNYNTTLQAVAIADIVQKSGIPLKILLSGGTNSMTGWLAQLCGLAVHGVSVGTFARNLVKGEIKTPDLDSKPDLIKRVVEKGRNLVNANIDSIKRV